MEMTSSPGERRFYAELLTLFGGDTPGRQRARIPKQYSSATLRGEMLLDDEAEHRIQTWTLPSDMCFGVQN